MLKKKPKDWRMGQTIFNFLEWLSVKKGVPKNQVGRMCDPFHISDEQMAAYYDEFLKENKG